MNLLLCLIVTLAAVTPAPEITGTIVDDRGKALSGIAVSGVSLPSSQEMEKTTSGPDGSFSFAGLIAGGYGIEANSGSDCAFSNAIQVSGGFTSVVRLRLVQGLCDGALVFVEFH